MGKLPIATVIEVTEERQQSTAVARRSICSVLKSHRQSSKHEHSCAIAHDQCHGPSLLHNLLPIVEPLLIIKPNLVFLENRILRRKQETNPNAAYKVPASINELRSWVKEASPSCECDMCVPKRYMVNGENPHGTILHTKSRSQKNRKSTRFSHGHSDLESQIQRQPTLRLRNYGHYEAMHLVRHHTEWLDQTYLQSPLGTDTVPIKQLRSLLHTWKSNLTSANLEKSLSKPQLQVLFPLLNEIFFFNALPSHKSPFSSSFSWLPESRKNCFAISFFNPLVGTHILMHPTLYRHGGRPEDLDVRWRNRVGTILHEMCHAFLKVYVCRSCPMSEQSVGPRGHGRAWQVLAKKMEAVAEKVLRGHVDFGRYPSLLHDFQGHGRLPSSHDLEVFGFSGCGAGCC